MYIPYVLAGAVCGAAILPVSWLARRVGLVARASGRHQHQGKPPLVGGVAVFMGMLAGGIASTCDGDELQGIWFCLAIIVALGVFDDRFDLPVVVRLLAQVALGVVLVNDADMRLHILPAGGIDPWTTIMESMCTITFILLVINAMNYIDGVDGLAGALSICAAIALNALTAPGSGALIALPMLLAAAMVPFLIFNLGPARSKVFLGDAGSTLAGLVLASSLVQLQGGHHRAAVVLTGLWFFALPVADLLVVSARRIVQRRSPFCGDRSHVHHLLIGCNLHPRAVLAVLTATAVVLAWFGHRLEGAGGGLNALLFAVVIACHALLTQRLIRHASAHHAHDSTPA